MYQAAAVMARPDAAQYLAPAPRAFQPDALDLLWTNAVPRLPIMEAVLTGVHPDCRIVGVSVAQLFHLDALLDIVDLQADARIGGKEVVQASFHCFQLCLFLPAVDNHQPGADIGQPIVQNIA